MTVPANLLLEATKHNVEEDVNLTEYISKTLTGPEQRHLQFTIDCFINAAVAFAIGDSIDNKMRESAHKSAVIGMERIKRFYFEAGKNDILSRK